MPSAAFPRQCRFRGVRGLPCRTGRADFTGAPIVSSVIADNNAAIAAITALPEDVLIYDPPL